MKSTSSLQSFLFLSIIIPFALSSECIPSLCPSKCCATKDTCASDQSQCNYCNAGTCSTGCCIDNKCAASASDCIRTGNFSFLVSLIVSIAAFILITFIIFFVAKKLVDRTEENRDLESQDKVLNVGKFVPIVEVQTSLKYETEVETIYKNEERPVEGEEINHNVFIQHIKEDRQSQEQYREAIYHYYEEHGEKPKKNESKGIKKEEQEAEAEEEYPAILLINAV